MHRIRIELIGGYVVLFICFKSVVKRIRDILFSNAFGEFIEKHTKEAVEEVLFSDEFREYLLSILEESEESPFKEIAEQYLNQEVVISTTVNMLTGTIVLVGDDYLVLEESSETTILLPFDSIIAIYQA